MMAILLQQRQKCANCKLCVRSWPLSHNIHTYALRRQAANFANCKLCGNSWPLNHNIQTNALQPKQHTLCTLSKNNAVQWMFISYLIKAVYMIVILLPQWQKCANCKLCGRSWPLVHNIHTNAVHPQAAHFMHIVEKHACLMYIDQILNNRRIHDGNFAATATKMCKLQTVWTFLAT